MEKLDSLGSKTLIMLVAPSAVGKSTIMNEVIELDTRFGRVRSFTTRAPRSNDEPGHYFYLTPDELADRRIAGDVITETMFPTTGQTYGTLAESYNGEFCLLDTLANGVADYRVLPFAGTITISLTAATEQWREQFLHRYPVTSDEAEQRLAEARLSIQWSLEDPETYWLVNKAEHTAETAAELIRLVEHPPARRYIPPEPYAMLELIERGVWRKK